MSRSWARRSAGQRGDRIVVDGSLAEEQAAEPPGQPIGGRRVLEEDRHQVVAVQAAAAAEDRLGLVVVPRGDVAEGAVVDGPAGQGAGGLLDVVLGVVADAEGEQLHQLAGEVLVGVPLAVRRGVEPDQQRRVADRGLEQLAERGRGHGGGTSSFCRRMAARSSTLRLLVAKWLCHISVSRSPSGSGPKSMR